jgi:hypothetical protein
MQYSVACCNLHVVLGTQVDCMRSVCCVKHVMQRRPAGSAVGITAT